MWLIKKVLDRKSGTWVKTMCAKVYPLNTRSMCTLCKSSNNKQNGMNHVYKNVPSINMHVVNMKHMKAKSNLG